MTADHRHAFATSGPPRLEARLATGSLEVLPGEPGRVELEISGAAAALEHLAVEQHGDTITLRPAPGGRAGVEVRVRVGEDAHLDARLAAADVRADAVLAVLRVTTASGDVSARRTTRETAVRTASGDIFLGAVTGRVEAGTASGDIRVSRLHADGAVTTVSGDLLVEQLDGALSLRSRSGTIDVRRLEGGDLRCQTVSGDVSLGLPPGRTLDVDLRTLSGLIRHDVAVDADGGGGPAGRLSVKTISGDIRLRSVPPG